MHESNKWDDIVGIDISKCTLDCYLVGHKTNGKQELHVENSYDGFDRLGRWLAKQNVDPAKTLLVSGHTSRYGEHMLRWTTTEGWNHAVVKQQPWRKFPRSITAKAIATMPAYWPIMGSV